MLSSEGRLALANRLFLSEYWALSEDKFEQLAALVESRLLMGVPMASEFEASSPTGQVNSQGAIAVIGINGVISYRANMFSNSSGGTSIEKLQSYFDSAVSDPNVSQIVLNIDSPGGGVSGVQEFAQRVYEARSKKKIYAIANPTAASGAYWIGSAAEKFYAIPSGQVGSVGVLAMYVDRSNMDQKMGVKRTVIKAGEYKGEGAAGEPLSDEALLHMQGVVNSYYTDFVNALAQNRKVSAKSVREDFGKGRMSRSQPAVDNRMIDGVKTFDGLISELLSKQAVSDRRKSLMAQYPQLLGSNQ